MHRKLLLFLLVFTSLNTFGQRVHWASRVEDFSSELSAYEYSAEQVLGKPNALPQGGTIQTHGWLQNPTNWNT
jgi:OOP family OmpA-OmpF porin